MHMKRRGSRHAALIPNAQAKPLSPVPKSPSGSPSVCGLIGGATLPAKPAGSIHRLCLIDAVRSSPHPTALRIAPYRVYARLNVTEIFPLDAFSLFISLIFCLLMAKKLNMPIAFCE